MEILAITNTLYYELVIFSLFLQGILLYNNVVLYKTNLSDKLTLLLFSITILSIIEVLLRLVDGKGGAMVAVNYLVGGLYTMSLFTISAVTNLTILEQFGIVVQRFRLFYILPGCIVLLLCITTPWTHFLLQVDENNVLQYMFVFDFVFAPFISLYVISLLIVVIRTLIKERKNHSEIYHTVRHFFIFIILVLLIYIVMDWIVAIDETYFLAGPCFSFPLVYLLTNLNTERLLNSQNRIATVEADLNIAANIQYGALPSVSHVLFAHPELQVYASMDTAKEVGGDFYDFFEIDSSHIGFVIADVSGKGMPAALFMMTVKTMIKDHASMKRSTAEIFTDVNRLLCENNPEEMFATAWIGILDTETHLLTYTNAGHNAPCFAKAGEGFEFLKKRHGLMLAGMEGTVYKEATLQLESGDTIFLYTDGVTEAHNEEGGLYGESRLISTMNRLEKRGDESFLLGIQRDVDAFATNTEQFDDITMLLIHLA